MSGLGPASAGPARSLDMSEQVHNKSRANIVHAVLLALVAIGFYVGFILVTSSGSVQ